MPTATKFLSALAFAALAFFSSEIFKGLLPQGTQAKLLSPVNAGIGSLCGWMIMGRLASHRNFRAIGVGIRTSVACLFWSLSVWSAWEMLEKSTKPSFYAGPFDAIIDVFNIMYHNLSLIFSDERFSFTLGDFPVFLPQVPLLLIIGGILCGWLAKWTKGQSEAVGKIV